MTNVMDAAPPVVVEVVRCGVVESRHRGHVAVLDQTGQLVEHRGDVTTARFARSVLKPVQATAMVGAGLDLPDPLLALVAASHAGAPHHVDGVREILAGAGLDESALRNAAGLPLGAEEAADYLRAGHRPAPVATCCSGKHAGTLATCVVNGWSRSGYCESNHPAQRAVHDRLIRLTSEQPRATGVDGCGAPTFAVSLAGVARAFRHLVLSPPGSPERRVVEAMRAQGAWASGDDRIDARLMRGAPGLVAKDGAEGFCAAALPDGRAVAVKVEDGSQRALGPLMATALRIVGLDETALFGLHSTPIFGGTAPVGEVRATQLTSQAGEAHG